MGSHLGAVGRGTVQNVQYSPSEAPTFATREENNTVAKLKEFDGMSQKHRGGMGIVWEGILSDGKTLHVPLDRPATQFHHNVARELLDRSGAGEPYAPVKFYEPQSRTL